MDEIVWLNLLISEQIVSITVNFNCSVQYRDIKYIGQVPFQSNTNNEEVQNNFTIA